MFVQLSFDVSQHGWKMFQSESAFGVSTIIHTVVVLVPDFLVPSVSLEPTEFQLFLQQTSSPRPIWQLHCIVESIVGPCCPTCPLQGVSCVVLQPHPCESPKPNQLP